MNSYFNYHDLLSPFFIYYDYQAFNVLNIIIVLVKLLLELILFYILFVSTIIIITIIISITVIVIYHYLTVIT
jgi:hypothetical protein